MRVLLVNTLYHPYQIGGAELSVQTIAEGLVDRGYRVLVITLGEVEEQTEHNGVQIHRFELQNAFWPFTALDRSKLKKLKWHIRDVYNTGYNNKIKQLIDDFQPDIFHTHNLTGFSVAVWDIAVRKKVKIVHTLRDYYLQCPKTNKFKNDAACQKLCTECKILSSKKKAISQKVDAVVGISNHILQSHLELNYFGSAIQKVIYNGFEIPEPSQKKVDFSKRSFVNFGYIGQVNTAKGVEVLFKSLAKHNTNQEWKLYVAGAIQPKYKDFLSTLLPKDRVEFLGYTKTQDFYKKIDVLIVSSKWDEPFGRVVLEGMFHRVIVLGSNRGGIKELLKQNDRFIFDPYTVELENLLDVILKNPEMLNQFSFKQAFTNQFSKDKMLDDYKNLYKKLNN